MLRCFATAAKELNWFNVIVFGAAQPVDERALVRDALQFAVEHARSSRPGHGLGAYTTWRQALESGTLPDREVDWLLRTAEKFCGPRLRFRTCGGRAKRPGTAQLTIEGWNERSCRCLFACC